MLEMSYKVNKLTQKNIPVIEEQSRALMQAVPDLVFLLGLDGSYIDIFSAAEEDLFLPREDLIGRTVMDVLPPPIGKDCMTAMSKLASPSDVNSFSYELLIDGKSRWFEGRVTLCGKDTVIVLVRDFTDQRVAENELRNANKALHLRARQFERMEQTLTQVEQRERRRMASMLHDNLQQLLAGAKFTFSIVEENITDEENKKYAKKGIKIVSEAIDQARMLTMDLCPPILYEGTLKQSLNWIKNHVARLHGLVVHFSIGAEDLTEFPESERLTIFNAIQELLLNVVKHSGVKSARIIVSKKPHGRIEVTVCDKGKGFDPVDIAETEYETGGFGLFMLKERLSWIGGHVNIDSRPGDGCTVTLNLPFDEKKSRPAVRKNSSPIKNSNAKRKIPNKSINVKKKEKVCILVADDHAVLREGLVRILQQESSFHVVGEAPDGETAIKMVAKLKPDVVLMDVMMPGMGGVQATRIICQHNPGIKVIALSMYEEKEQGSEMTAAGAIDYVTKNNASDKIVKVIRSCCGLELPLA